MYLGLNTTGYLSKHTHTYCYISIYWMNIKLIEVLIHLICCGVRVASIPLKVIPIVPPCRWVNAIFFIFLLHKLDIIDVIWIRITIHTVTIFHSFYNTYCIYYTIPSHHYASCWFMHLSIGRNNRMERSKR